MRQGIRRLCDAVPADIHKVLYRSIVINSLEGENCQIEEQRHPSALAAAASQALSELSVHRDR